MGQRGNKNLLICRRRRVYAVKYAGNFIAHTICTYILASGICEAHTNALDAIDGVRRLRPARVLFFLLVHLVCECGAVLCRSWAANVWHAP